MSTTTEAPQDNPSDNPQHLSCKRHSAKGKYAKRIPKGKGRWCQHICFDATTSEQLQRAQRLEQLRVSDNSWPSRTLIIRRAVQLYSSQLLKDAQAGLDLSGEVRAMLE